MAKNMAKNTLWQKTEAKTKKYKIFMYGPPGSYKTRTALRLGSNGPENPTLAVVDTEFGVDHYQNEFNFVSAQTPDPDEIFEAVQQISSNPGGVKTICIDTFSVYYEALINKYADLFLKREIRSSGHKGEYFSIAPKDYQIINREASNFVRFLLKCDMHVICNCQVKDKWGGDMKVIGTSPDGWKRLPYYFDIVIELVEAKEGFQAIIHKDRTHHLDVSKKYPWSSDEEGAALITKAIGCRLSDGPETTPYKEKEKKPPIKETAKEAVKETPKESAKEAKKPTEEKAAADVPFSNSFLDAKSLLMEIVKLKKELRILDKNEWDKLLVPFKVKTAKDLSTDQLGAFISTLEAMRPTEAPPF
jgi:hypothetical protein